MSVWEFFFFGQISFKILYDFNLEKKNRIPILFEFLSIKTLHNSFRINKNREKNLESSFSNYLDNLENNVDKYSIDILDSSYDKNNDK